MWHKIPKEIMDELEELRKFTRRTGNEASFTYCKRPHKDKLYIGSDFQGNTYGTIVGDCSKEYGSGSRIGDAHSHPVVSDAVGITPSDADIFGSIEESKKSKREQINCITSHHADIVHCMQPKEIPSRKQYEGYKKIATKKGKINPYIIDNFSRDFNVGLFDRESGERIENPEPKRIVNNAFGTSHRHLRRAIRNMERGVFCDFIQDVFNPSDDRVSDECKSELKKKGLLDYLGIQ